MDRLAGLAVLASRLEENLNKTAARNRSRTSRKQVLKNIDKSKATYQTERKRQKDLQKQIGKLETQLEESEAKVKGSRSKMLKLKKVLSNMDLADCNYVLMYDNGDCGYIIDGEEYSLDVNDVGELDMLPMKEFRRNRRKAELQELGPDNNELDISSLELDEETEDLEELGGPDELIFSNLRLLD